MKTAMARIDAAQLAEFDSAMFAWAHRVAYQGKLTAYWPSAATHVNAFYNNETVEGACQFLLAYLTAVTETGNVARLPGSSRRLICRFIARLEERLLLFGHTEAQPNETGD